MNIDELLWEIESVIKMLDETKDVELSRNERAELCKQTADRLRHATGKFRGDKVGKKETLTYGGIPITTEPITGTPVAFNDSTYMVSWGGNTPRLIPVPGPPEEEPAVEIRETEPAPATDNQHPVSNTLLTMSNSVNELLGDVARTENTRRFRYRPDEQEMTTFTAAQQADREAQLSVSNRATPPDYQAIEGWRLARMRELGIITDATPDAEIAAHLSNGLTTTEITRRHREAADRLHWESRRITPQEQRRLGRRDTLWEQLTGRDDNRASR